MSRNDTKVLMHVPIERVRLRCAKPGAADFIADAAGVGHYLWSTMSTPKVDQSLNEFTMLKSAQITTGGFARNVEKTKQNETKLN